VIKCYLHTVIKYYHSLVYISRLLSKFLMLVWLKISCGPCQLWNWALILCGTGELMYIWYIPVLLFNPRRTLIDGKVMSGFAQNDSQSLFSWSYGRFFGSFLKNGINSWFGLPKFLTESICCRISVRNPIRSQASYVVRQTWLTLSVRVFRARCMISTSLKWFQTILARMKRSI